MLLFELALARQSNAEVADLFAEGVAVDAEHFGGLELVSLGLLQDQLHQGALHLTDHLRVQVLDVVALDAR